MTTFISLPAYGESPYWGEAAATAASLPTTGDVTGQVVFVLDTATLYYWDGAAWQAFVDGLADVSGPASSTDEALARFSGITGKIIENSAATLSDAGLLITANVRPTSTTASRAVVTDGSKNLASSATTATELGYVSGVTSPLQTQIDAKVTGPASATTLAIVKYNGTTGKLVQDSGVTIDASNNVAGAARVEASTAHVGGTGAVATSTTLEVGGTTGAFLLPRLTTTQKNALTPAAGMIVFDTTENRAAIYLGAPVSAWTGFPGWGD